MYSAYLHLVQGRFDRCHAAPVLYGRVDSKRPTLQHNILAQLWLPYICTVDIQYGVGRGASISLIFTPTISTRVKAVVVASPSRIGGACFGRDAARDTLVQQCITPRVVFNLVTS